MVAVSRDQGQIHCDVLSAMFVYKVPLCGTAALTDFIVSPRTELLDMTMFVLKTLTIHNFTTLTGPYNRCFRRWSRSDLSKVDNQEVIMYRMF